MKSLKHTAFAVILLLSVIFTLSGCSAEDIVSGPEDDGTQTMKEEDFYDLEKTHMPTDEEVLEIKDRIDKQWDKVFQRWEELGSPKIESYVNFAKEQGIELITFADVIAAIGRPHHNNPYTGMYYIEWETTSGGVFDFAFTISRENAMTPWLHTGDLYEGVNSMERYFWLYEHYGVAENFPQYSVA